MTWYEVREWTDQSWWKLVGVRLADETEGRLSLAERRQEKPERKFRLFKMTEEVVMSNEQMPLLPPEPRVLFDKNGNMVAYVSVQVSEDGDVPLVVVKDGKCYVRQENHYEQYFECTWSNEPPLAK